jgi:hypothetical protein
LAHWQRIVQFLDEKLPLSPADATDAYIATLKKILVLAAHIDDNFFRFITNELDMIQFRDLSRLSRFFALFSEAPSNDFGAFSLPPPLLPEALREPLVQYNRLQRVLVSKRCQERYFPFYFMLRDWANSFVRYPPCTIAIAGDDSLSIRFLDSFVPKAIMLFGAAGKLAGVVLVTAGSDSTSENLAGPIQVSSASLTLKFDHSIREERFIVINADPSPDHRLIAFQHRSQFESDIIKWISFSEEDDQAILKGFQASRFAQPYLPLQVDVEKLEDVGHPPHFVHLRALFLIAFNWELKQAPFLGQSESFHAFRRFVSILASADTFAQAIKKTEKPDRLHVSIDRVLAIDVRNGVSKELRHSMLGQLSLKYFDPASLRASKDPFHVTFVGEMGIDCGGLSRDFVTELFKEVAAPNVGLFVPTPNSRNAVGAHRDCFVPSPHPSLGAADHIYETFGALLASTMRTSNVQPLFLPPLFFRYIVNGRLGIEDVFEIDDRYRAFIEGLLAEKSPEALASSFSLSNTVLNLRNEVIALETDIRTITAATVERYVQAANAQRIAELEGPLRAIRRGFWDALGIEIPPSVTPRLIEFMTCAERTLNVLRLKDLTEFRSIPNEEQAMFWTALSRMDEDQKRAFLQFATGSSSIPINPRNPFLVVDRGSGAMDASLPTASTCFFKLHLPIYTTAEKMFQKLVLAAEFSGNFENS